MKLIEGANKHRFLSLGSLFCLFLSMIFLSLSFSLTKEASGKYIEKSLRQLKNKKQIVQKEFQNTLDEMHTHINLLRSRPFPEDENEIFSLLKALISDPEIEGVGFYDNRGNILLWFGNVVDVKDVFSAQSDHFPPAQIQMSQLVKNKASSFLVNIEKVQPDKFVIFHRLLAFQPELKSPYLTEYHFLKTNLLKNSVISYIDFQDSVSGYERIFSGPNDEFVGEISSSDNILTLFFPLRNEEKRIISTVTLSSPPMPANNTFRQDNFLSIFYVFFGLFMVFSLVLTLKVSPPTQTQRPLSGLLPIPILIGIRLIIFPLSQIEKIQALPVFSPSTAGFFSFLGFTKSPADIFLTSSFLFLIFGYLLLYFFWPSKEKKGGDRFFPALASNAFFVFLAFALLFLFQETLFSLVLNSNLNLLRFSFNPSFLLIHLSVLLFFLLIISSLLVSLRCAFSFTQNISFPLGFFIIYFIVYLFLFKNRGPLLVFLQAVTIFACIFWTYRPKIRQKKEFLFAFICLSTFLVYASIEDYATSRHRNLLQNTIKNSIESQKDWGKFLIKQSQSEIDVREESIRSFFKSFEPSNLAHTLWGMTLISQFNWYSSLELLNPDGSILSRFSLNVPEYSRIILDLPQSQEWTISSYKIPFLGREKDFLLAYKDYFEEDDHLGKLIIYLSLDYDMLPFLYSANPYFELLRVSSLPSLNELDFGFAVYDLEGKLLFNPYTISSGIDPDLLQEIEEQSTPLWSSFDENKKHYLSFYFKDDNKIYSLFLPKETVLDILVEYLEIFFLYLFFSMTLFLVISITITRQKPQNPFWSFSNRVYLSFVVVALIPLILFTFLTKNFFDQIFAQQITKKAEYQAELAQNVMNDYLYSQEEEQISMSLLPDDLVFWISSTISNDVNLYEDGFLTSSSRREFFDYGLLPDLINGEIYYKMQYENNPFHTQAQKIGDYSFQTLTIPYFFQERLYLISLPFPLQQQEISENSEKLIEFFVLISVFFLAAVLLFARGIGGMIIKPIQKLLAGIKEVSLGNLEITIPHKTHDEMKTLIDGFNTMIRNLKQHQQDLTDMSKKVAWAEMARKVAHEIKNPLTPIQLSAEHLINVYNDKSENFDAALKESTSYIIHEVENLRRIAHEFLETSKEGELKKDILDLQDIINETIAPYKNILTKRIQIKEHIRGEDFLFSGDKVKIKIALRNILTNAIEAIHKKGAISISLSRKNKILKLVIQDTGTGIGQDMLNRIFEPYFSTKDVGTGLGLPIAKKIIEDHKGSIEAMSQKNKATTITIRLPEIQSVL
ncbi:ATP-binding protein [Acidobacteriota bacterium]